jgi:hypothetical protein
MRNKISYPLIHSPFSQSPHFPLLHSHKQHGHSHSGTHGHSHGPGGNCSGHGHPHGNRTANTPQSSPQKDAFLSDLSGVTADWMSDALRRGGHLGSAKVWLFLSFEREQFHIL